jgi:16S rRNA (guanine(966)-N(2))-methyltransferase RsmD
LLSPTWAGLRPTADRLRETLFNVLTPRVAGARVMDGYAGTGAVGIEALSRGAAQVTFVDSDSRAQALIAENLGRCEVQSGYAIIRATVARSAQVLRNDPAFVPFDLIFLDPPYDLRSSATSSVTLTPVHEGSGPRSTAAVTTGRSVSKRLSFSARPAELPPPGSSAAPDSSELPRSSGTQRSPDRSPRRRRRESEASSAAASSPAIEDVPAVPADPFAELLMTVTDLLAPDGVIVLEHARRQAPPETAGRLARSRLLRSGDSSLSFYTCQP